MMKTCLSLALALLLSGSLCFGQTQLPQLEFERYELDNGLKVILHQDDRTPIVVVSVMYHVGSKNESPDRTGFAHFFEHLMFEGSANIDRGEFDDYVERAGGQLNASTSHDRTYYFEVLPSNQLALGLWLESERMLHAKVDEVGVETQREVVKEERRQRIDNRPYGSLLEEVFQRAFKEHPYRWPVIGSMDHLNAATETDYQQFYADFYVPNNAVLSIAGDIDTEATKQLIDKYFGTIPAGEPVNQDLGTEPALGGEVRDTVYDQVQLPAVVQGYRTPAMGTDDYYAVDMLTSLLSDGESSRLNRKLVDSLEMALFAGTFPLSLEDPGVALAFSIATAGTEVAALEAAINAEVADLSENLVSEREMEKLRNQIENDFVSTRGSLRSLASQLATYEAMQGDANLINTELNRYLAVTREDIRRVARKYFVPENRVTLHWLPQPAR